MQHSERSKDTIVAWDSAYGDYLQSFTSGGSPAGILDHAYKTAEEQNQRKTAGDRSLLTPAFDGSASWWTQGLGHGNPRLALTAAHAAGRYGHVMFANAIHQPALTLAETVLHNSRNPNLSKIFYSDNGSTGMEVAVKMALRATMEELRLEHTRDLDIRIVGLKNSYHGDTIGTMDCSEPSIYNKKVEWYRGRGIWLDFPTVKMRRGKWLVEPIAGDTSFKTRYFDSLTDIFDFKKRHRERKKYKEYIRTTLWEQMEREGAIPGALIIEPVILGAGGMLFADPLYQRCLVEVAREDDSECWEDSESDIDEDGEYWGDWKGMPVIFDEVFTGLYRLGRFSAASFLGVNPDIVVNAKLLTGGLLPLCTTAASKSIFEAFLSDDKTDALLHGHSYTAHPVGCAVANESLRTMMTLETDGSWESFKKDWVPVAKRPLDLLKRTVAPAWSMWSSTFVAQVSHRKSVDHVFALGTVLAICVKDPGGGGYASTAATGLRDALMAREAGGESNAVVHSRVMGNVLYLMTALTTPVETVRDLEKRVLDVLK
jgi:dethiobiotin synthetase/adenosylmethionine--8-amino-7-oxononanoate aminotransferase